MRRIAKVWHFEDLAPQLRWMGTQLQSTGFLVCPDCMDEPAPFERTLILPPDPPPVYNGRQAISRSIPRLNGRFRRLPARRCSRPWPI